VLVRTLVAAVIGFGSGIASGAFGIGGALLSTPGIRVLLNTPAIIAVGTTLPVIVPTAITGLRTFARDGYVDRRLATVAACAGGVFAVVGAYVTKFASGELILVITAAFIFVMSLRMLPTPPVGHPPRFPSTVPVFLVVGATSGFVSGFLGVGGGVILVPAFTVLLRMPVKTALGTSLAIVAAQAIPGTVVHALLGHVDWGLAAGLLLGVVPGAQIGSKLAVRTEDRRLRTVVALTMAALAIAFGLGELRELGR
jgi:uncharacterized protein